MIRRWHGAAGGRITANLSPRFILSCSRELWEGVGALAAAHDVSIHTHLNESPGEVKAIEAAVGSGAVAYFDALGLLSPRFVGAHGVWFDDAERRLLAERGARITHCPSANFKLAAGACDVRALHDAGVIVGLGADGAPCNNRIDPFAEMRLAGLVSRWIVEGPRAVGRRHRRAGHHRRRPRAAHGRPHRQPRGGQGGGLRRRRADRAPPTRRSPAPIRTPRSSTRCSAAAVRTVVCGGQVVSHRGRVRAWDGDDVVADAERAPGRGGAPRRARGAARRGAARVILGPATIITGGLEPQVVPNAAIRVVGAHFAALGPFSDVRLAFPEDAIFDTGHRIILPGFVDALVAAARDARRRPGRLVGPSGAARPSWPPSSTPTPGAPPRAPRSSRASSAA